MKAEVMDYWGKAKEGLVKARELVENGEHEEAKRVAKDLVWDAVLCLKHVGHEMKQTVSMAADHLINEDYKHMPAKDVIAAAVDVLNKMRETLPEWHSLPEVR